MSIEIQINTDNGSAFGYVADRNEPNIQNYLSNHTAHASTITKLLNQRFEKVALLRNMHVDEGCRLQGEGTELMLQFMESARMAGADILMLVCDSDEDQIEGFDLTRFYEGFEMARSIQTSSGPLMFTDEDFAGEIVQMVKRLEQDVSPSP
jgi:hypothetical protein